MLYGCTNLWLTRSSLSMGKQDVYRASFNDGKLHILRKTFTRLAETVNMFVTTEYVSMLLLLTNSQWDLLRVYPRLVVTIPVLNSRSAIFLS